MTPAAPLPSTVPATPAGWNLLLLSRDPAWADAVRHELDRQGRGTVALATSPEDALTRLVEPSHAYSHLLVEPHAAGPYLRDLVGVSAGESGSQVQLVAAWRGPAARWSTRHCGAPALPEDLPGLLGQPDGDVPADLPPMSTSERGGDGFRADQLAMPLSAHCPPA